MRENKSAYWGGTLRLCIIIALTAMLAVAGASLLRLADAKGSGGRLYYRLGADMAIALLFYLVSCGALIAHRSCCPSLPALRFGFVCLALWFCWFRASPFRAKRAAV